MKIFEMRHPPPPQPNKRNSNNRKSRVGIIKKTKQPSQWILPCWQTYVENQLVDWVVQICGCCLSSRTVANYRNFHGKNSDLFPPPTPPKLRSPLYPPPPTPRHTQVGAGGHQGSTKSQLAEREGGRGGEGVEVRCAVTRPCPG